MVNDFLLDFAIASLFIMLGQLIRAKIKVVQKFFVPASMIGGFIALALGTQGANVLPFSKNIGSYPGCLIILIFAAVGINGFTFSKKAFKAEMTRIGSYFSYKVLAQAIQFAFAPLFSILVISKLFPEINYGFGLLLAAGFSGGHGTAAAVGSAFQRLGFTDAMDIGMTCATVGILAGIFGGLFFIKIGTKRGWTKYIKSFQYISGDLKTGLVPETHRKSMGAETISSVVLDPLAWHLAILLACSGAGLVLNRFIFARTGLDLPTYLVAFLIAIVVFLIFRNTGVGSYIDVATLMYYGAAMNKGSWFERALFVFGYSTGVFAIGFILLRIVDPDNLSKTLNDTAFAAPFTTPAEMFAWSMGPIMLLNGRHWEFIALYTAIFFGCIILNKMFHWWWLDLPLDRPAEGECK